MKNSELHRLQSRIDSYRAGKLSEEEADLLWMDLIEYPEQMEYLVNSINLEAIAVTEQQKSAQKTTSKRVVSSKKTALYHITNKWGRVAAVLLVGIGLLSTSFFWGSDVIFEPKPIANIELDSYRSSTIPTEVFDYQVQRAINMASLEQYEEAIDMLKEIESRDLSREQQISLKVNKGSVHYNQGDFTSARVVFHEILDQYDEMHILTEEQVQWFLGNTYLQLGQEDLAQVHIQKTYDLNGAYRRLAERYLK